MREVVVYRHNLFRISEPFIVQQAGRLRRFKPLYLGRFRYGSVPLGAESLALEDLAGLGRFHRLVSQVITRDPRSYLRLLAGRRPALIHAHFGVEGVYALRLAKRLGVPLVTTFHGFDATLSTAAMLCSPVWANYPLFRKRLARQGDLFLCVSSFIRERVLALGFPEERTHVHYIGVDTRAIRSRESAAENPWILHVARLVEMKGTEYLIRAFSKVASDVPKAKLIIIGDGPRRRHLQQLGQSMGLGGQIQFLGAQPHAEVINWMHKAAMLVLPSVRTRTGRTEGLGMVVLEAAAAGVPAIGTRHGGIPEVIIDGETGYLVPERDTDELAVRMTALLMDRDKQRRMGGQARALVEARFDIEDRTAALELLYDEVLTHDQRRGR
ncbi:MAG: glycosyl transferase [Chromatiales bacterium 21-64-14]|nr:MAG: glycosyl transferase [Chromatiales bacterium 21-64-14]HQU15600.1 glycosyltransferase [Gammaproteobacteria bacterium]